MQNKSLQITKKRLAVIFALIVFFIAFLLEFIYFSLKYYNITYIEKRDFTHITNNFIQEVDRNSRFLDNFLNNFYLRWNGGFSMRAQNPFRFLDFVIIDKNGDIIFENLSHNDFYTFKISKIDTSNVFFKNGIGVRKIDFINHQKLQTIIFFKKQIYSLQDYWKDLFFFFIVNGLFSILFYYIWLYFAGKNLKPIDDILNDMNDFIHNANHELKTPIAVIHSNLQIIKATKKYETSLIENSILEIKRIDNLLWELSSLSDINSIWEIEDLDIWKEIQEILQEYEKIIGGKKLKIHLEIKKNIFIKANKHYFYMLFSNLLRNAIRYNIESWEIKIILEKNKFIISNTWNWISKEDLPYIFDRFFKGEKSRNKEWFGIWLSLVKKICDLYKWEIYATSDEKNTSFQIVF